MELGGLWWTNALNSAIPPQRHRPDTWLEHKDPVSHPAQKKKAEKERKKEKKERKKERKEERREGGKEGRKEGGKEGRREGRKEGKEISKGRKTTTTKRNLERYFLKCFL